jgi:hypothetical protein
VAIGFTPACEHGEFIGAVSAFAALPTKIIVSEPARAHVSNAPAVPDLELACMNLANPQQLLSF